MRTLTHEPLAFAFAALLLVAIAAIFIVGAALAIRAIVAHFKTRSGRKARPAGAGTESAGNAFGATGPGVVSLVRPTPGPAPTVARAALTPDCPSLDTEYWRANPIEPLAPSEVVRWNGIVSRYEWVAPTVVVPGRES